VVHTEYHILISIHEILDKYSTDDYEIKMIIKRSKRSNRLEETLDLTSLPIQFEFWEYGLSFDKMLDAKQRELLDSILMEDVSEFIFFQEQDPFVVIMVNHFSKKGTRIYLYQDGLKPYVSIRYFSLSLMKHHIIQNRWIKKNGYLGEDVLSFLICKKYGFLKNIEKLFLTFPGEYKNWKNKPIEKISLQITPAFKNVLKRVYKWNENMLTERTNVLFYMNQPMHDDGVFETEMLGAIVNKFPNNKLYIKLHPSTNEINLKLYKSLKNVELIESPIPAELFISELSNSLILSIASTSMFIDNSACKFYWIYKVAEDHIPRLKRYRMANPTTHIQTISSLENISFR
jgi:hypothetical protein